MKTVFFSCNHQNHGNENENNNVNNTKEEKVVWNARLGKFDPFLQIPAGFNVAAVCIQWFGVTFPFAQNLFACYGGQ